MNSGSFTYLSLALILVLLARHNWLCRVRSGDIERLFAAYGFAFVGLSTVAAILTPALSGLRGEPGMLVERVSWVMAALGAAFFARRGSALLSAPWQPWRAFTGVLGLGLVSLVLLSVGVGPSRQAGLMDVIGLQAIVRNTGIALAILTGTVGLGLMSLGHWQAATAGGHAGRESSREHRLHAVGFAVGVFAVWAKLGIEHWFEFGDTTGDTVVLVLLMVGGFGLVTSDAGNVQAEEARLSQSERRLEETEELLREHTAALREALLGATSTLATVAAERDPYTATHQERMAHLARRIADELFPDNPDLVDGIHITAKLHDIGKLSIPYDILNKSGPLDPLQWELVRGHASAGAKILAGLKLRWPVDQWVQQHHERLDGSGYPNGLRGDHISIGARIFAVADVVEAMCSHRPHRPALGLEAALEEIALGAGQRYDQRVVSACLEIFEQKGYRLPEDGDGRSGAFLAPGASSALHSGYWLRAHAGG